MEDHKTLLEDAQALFVHKQFESAAEMVTRARALGSNDGPTLELSGDLHAHFNNLGQACSDYGRATDHGYAEYEDKLRVMKKIVTMLLRHAEEEKLPALKRARYREAAKWIPEILKIKADDAETLAQNELCESQLVPASAPA